MTFSCRVVQRDSPFAIDGIHCCTAFQQQPGSLHVAISSCTVQPRSVILWLCSADGSSLHGLQRWSGLARSSENPPNEYDETEISLRARADRRSIERPVTVHICNRARLVSHSGLHGPHLLLSALALWLLHEAWLYLLGRLHFGCGATAKAALAYVSPPTAVRPRSSGAPNKEDRPANLLLRESSGFLEAWPSQIRRFLSVQYYSVLQPGTCSGAVTVSKPCDQGHPTVHHKPTRTHSTHYYSRLHNTVSHAIQR